MRKPLIAFRTEQKMIDRVKSLVEPLSKDPHYRGTGLSYADVARTALIRGLDVLERELKSEKQDC